MVDEFIGRVIKFGDSLGVVIPANVVKFCGLKQDQILKIYFKPIKE